jgi:hypothetical protein
MGCIGRIDAEQINGALDAVAQLLTRFGIDQIT